MNRKKIVLIANTSWNIVNFRLNLVEKFKQEGYDVYVLSPFDEYSDYLEKDPRIEFSTLKRLKRDSLNPFYDFSSYLEMTRKLKKIQPDIVINFTIKPNILGGLVGHNLKLNTIAVVTGLGYTFIHKNWLKTLAKFLYKKTLKYHQKIIFENTDDKNLFIDSDLVPRKKAFAVKGCGVNTDYYYPSEERKVDNLTFTFIGRLLYDKGLREFVEASVETRAKLPNTRFLVAGNIDADNPAAVSEEDLQKWQNLSEIEFLGFIEDIRKVIDKSDVIVLPSYREGMSRVIMEAMSMAKPIIATDVPGCREIIEDHINGLLVIPRETKSLQEAFVEMYNMPEEMRRNMGTNGRLKMIGEFNDKKIADQLFDLIVNNK